MLQLEQQLDQLARSMGKSRSACVREAIAQYVQRFSTTDEAQRQSALIAAADDSANWSWDYPDSVDRRQLARQRGAAGASQVIQSVRGWSDRLEKRKPWIKSF